MGTIANESLFSIIQNFLSPDVLQKISTEINQPIEKTTIGLKSVIPTMLMGIINKGSTKEGAEGLVVMTTTQQNTSVVSSDWETMKKGEEVLTNIFGNKLSNTISTLGVSTGMSTTSISKMMGISAPFIMGLIGTKIKKEKMSATGLMSFLKQQKFALMSYMPGGFSEVAGFTAIQRADNFSKVWPRIVLGILVVIGGIWLINSISSRQTTTLAPVEKTILPVNKIPNIWSIQNFMSSGAKSGTAKRYRFEKTLFMSDNLGTIVVSNEEINQIVLIMKTYPNATARIESFTDNTGPNLLNEELSLKRALIVKNELVSKGIEPERLKAVGMGEKNPIKSNESEQGRSLNRRIEFIITK